MICLYFFMLFRAHNTLGTPFTHKITTPRILWCVSFFPKNMHDPMFSQGFLENQSFNTKWKSNWCLFQQINSGNSSDIMILRKPKNNPNTMIWLQGWVLAAWIMRNHFAYLHERKQSLPSLNTCGWNEERSSLIIFSQIQKVPCSPSLSLMHFSWKTILAKITPYTRGKWEKSLMIKSAQTTLKGIKSSMIKLPKRYWLVLKSAFLSRFYIIILHLKYQ